MKERPIIFNAEMIRAILDGRKTQTRRLVPEWQRPKHYPDNDDEPRYNWMAVAQSDRRWGYGVFGETEEACAKELSEMAPCPFGNAGDRLWVRETFSAVTDHEEPAGCSALLYAADDQGQHGKWTPSIHMPRWASRITLEITSVRVERLNDISDADAAAEGCSTKDMKSGDCLADVFARIWASIYSAENWQGNPWVWVIEFKRAEASND